MLQIYVLFFFSDIMRYHTKDGRIALGLFAYFMAAPFTDRCRIPPIGKTLISIFSSCHKTII